MAIVKSLSAVGAPDLAASIDRCIEEHRSTARQLRNEAPGVVRILQAAGISEIPASGRFSIYDLDVAFKTAGASLSMQRRLEAKAFLRMSGLLN